MTINTDVQKTMENLDRLIDWEAGLTSREELTSLLKEGQKLKIKYGVDLTAPTLHLGHAVNLQAMRMLQDLGHEVQFLAGSFTTQVGDPTGKNETRKTTPLEEIAENKKLFLEQIGLVLKLDNETFSEHDNLDWWSKMSLTDFFGLLGEVTHAQLIQRDMFQERISSGNPIAMTELMYPLLQGWDSVELKSDLTIVGTDQLFNEKMGRMFQQRSGQRPQAIVCTKITPGLDGGAKQSKSIGNYVGLSCTPFEMYARTMLLLDELVPQWMEVYTNTPLEEVAECRENFSEDPLKWKNRLAWLVVDRFHGSEEADSAKERFENERLGDDEVEDMPDADVNGMTILEACAKTFDESNSWVRRMLESGAVRVNDDQIENPEHIISSGDIVRVGKKKANRLFRVS